MTQVIHGSSVVARGCLAILLSLNLGLAQVSIAPIKAAAPVVVRPYLPVQVPSARLGNSPRLRELVRAGILYLTAQDAIALALENNIDIEIARYNPLIADWNIERAEAGGALPGVPSGASQAGSVASGQGVAGSQAAAGVSITGGSSNNVSGGNAAISQVGPVTQNLDPSVQETTTFSHNSTPQPNVVQSLTPVLISATHVYTGSYQQGFLTGGAITATYSEHYLKENAATDLLNPSVDPNLSISAQHNLLRGFGIAVNARNINIAKMNRNTSDLDFKTRVISIVSQTLDAYYALAEDYEDLSAKKNAGEVAQTLFNTVKEQVRLGSIAPTEVITSEAQLVTSQQALVDSQASLQTDEVRLRNLISRTGTAEPVLAGARIMPVDKISIPESDDLPPVGDMVKRALANRSDLASEQAGLRSNEVSMLGTRNGVLPTLVAFGAESQAGLAGVPKTVRTGNGFIQQPDPYFVGGLGTALGDVFRRNFPTERVGAFFQAAIENRQAQADYAIDQLSFRQSQLMTQKDLNQVEVDIRNYAIALRQARARYEASVHNRVLQEQLFSAEQRKYNLGASAPYLVIQQQRDLVNAQAAEVSAKLSYSNAKIGLDQALGTTLEANHITMAEAREGAVARPPVIPAEPAKP